MPIRKRNPDGSLSYTQTEDEKRQNNNEQSVKQLNRTVKKLTERVERLEAKVNTILAEKDTQQPVASETEENTAGPKKLFAIM